uniref:fibronectin type III domain-containing protein n=1 Tax=uncultured Duncaniella sp. TaxID=2768039 RepID=UPI00260F5384
MKLHILLITLAFSAGLALTSCSDEMDYSAPLTRFEVDGVSVTPGDESALLTWQPQADKPEPVSYLISWVSGSADGNGGSDEIGGNVTSYTVLGLTNDVAYTFSVQARYPDGLARKISVTAAPKTTRIPVGDFKAVAGDKCVFLSWTSPETSLSYTSEIVVTQNGNPVKTVECAKGESSTLVQDLTNDLEYTFTITNVYDHGRSVSLSSSAVPGHITPITCMPESPRPFEICQLEYNPAFFVQGTIASVEWKVEGVVVSKDSKITYLFTHPGVIPVTITVTFTNGQTASGTIDVEVQPFAWTEFPNAGYQKASNFAFSPDGQTLYSISQSTKVLYAIDAIAGTVKWQHTFDAATYGAGVAVGKDGKIYFGTEDKDGTLYAFMPSGTVRWTAKMGAAVKAAPAVTSDGVVYALCDGAKLKA